MGLPNYGPSAAAGYSVPAIASAILGSAITAMSALGTAKTARDKEKDGPESTIAKKRAQLQSSLAKIEIMVYSLTQKQNEQNERECRYARLRVEAAEDLQVRTITSPADATSA